MRLFSSTRSSCVTLPSPLVIWLLQLAGCQIVEIELAPVVALGEPDDFVVPGRYAPVDAAVAGLEERRRPSPRARRARRRSPHRRRAAAPACDRARWRQRRPSMAVRIPLHVGPLAAAARDVVAQRGAVLVGRHLEADRPSPASTSMTTRWIIATMSVARQRILPRLQLGMADVVSTRYISPTLRWSCWKVAIFLESGDQTRIGAVALRPAGVVGGVAEVLDAVGRQLRLLAGRDVAHPEIPVANEGRAFCRRAR